MWRKSIKRGNDDGSGQSSNKRQKAAPVPPPPMPMPPVRMPEPWYPDGEPPKPLPYRHDPALEAPYVPVPEHLRIKMPMPDLNYRARLPPDMCDCEECRGADDTAAQNDSQAYASGSQPQQNLVWTTYDNSGVTPQNPYARPMVFYGPQPPANAPRPAMWWAAPPNPNPTPFPYDARRNDPYRDRK